MDILSTSFDGANTPLLIHDHDYLSVGLALVQYDAGLADILEAETHCVRRMQIMFADEPDMLSNGMINTGLGSVLRDGFGIHIGFTMMKPPQYL